MRGLRKSSQWLRVAVVLVAASLLGMAAYAQSGGEAKPAPATGEPVERSQPAPAAAVAAEPVVLIKTSMGVIEVVLYPDKAPISVANFLQYVDDGFYDGTIFHRVIGNFMVQGGGFTPDYHQKPARPAIRNEADNGLKNERYTLAMARTQVVDSATAQFFINVQDNVFLDHRSRDQRGFGYAVFGRVVAGQGVVDAIKAVRTGPAGPFRSDAPQEPVIIESIRRKPAVVEQPTAAEPTEPKDGDE